MTRGTRKQRLTEDDLVTLFPHFRNDRLTGNDDTRESNFDILVLSKGLEDMFTRDTHRAQTMKDCNVSHQPTAASKEAEETY